MCFIHDVTHKLDEIFMQCLFVELVHHLWYLCTWFVNNQSVLIIVYHFFFLKSLFTIWCRLCFLFCQYTENTFFSSWVPLLLWKRLYYRINFILQYFMVIFIMNCKEDIQVLNLYTDWQLIYMHRNSCMHDFVCVSVLECEFSLAVLPIIFNTDYTISRDLYLNIS